MERRDFLKFALGAVAGGAALAASAQAAPLMPAPLAGDGRLPVGNDAQPAVTSENETERLTPEQVRWRRGWRRRRWRRRHYGWHGRRRWRRRYWRRRYW